MPSAMANEEHVVYAKYGCTTCRIPFNNLHEMENHFDYKNRATSGYPCVPITHKKGKFKFFELGKIAKTPDFVFACSSCDETFIAEGDLVIHQRVHDGENPFKCDLCEMSFKSKGQFVSHKINHMVENKDEPVKSPKSPTNNRENEILNNIRKDKIKCAFCRKLFLKSNRNALTDHVMKTHSNKLWKASKDKKLNCTDCDEKFDNKGDLKAHRKIHWKVREKPKLCICKFCGKKTILSNHKCSFANGLYCKPCDKTFDNKAAFILHRRKHVLRPFTCVKCKHSFSQEASMNKHKCNAVFPEIEPIIEKDINVEVQNDNNKTPFKNDPLLIIDEDVTVNTREEEVDDPLSVSYDEIAEDEANASNILVINEDNSEVMQDTSNKKNTVNKPSYILVKDIKTLTGREEIVDHSARYINNKTSDCVSKMKSISSEDNIVEMQNMKHKKNSNDDPLNNTLNTEVKGTIDDPLDISDIDMNDSVNNNTDDEITVSFDSTEGTEVASNLKGISEFQNNFCNSNDAHEAVIENSENSNNGSIYKGFVVLETPLFFDTSDLFYIS